MQSFSQDFFWFLYFTRIIKNFFSLTFPCNFSFGYFKFLTFCLMYLVFEVSQIFFFSLQLIVKIVLKNHYFSVHHGYHTLLVWVGAGGGGIPVHLQVLSPNSAYYFYYTENIFVFEINQFVFLKSYLYRKYQHLPLE